METKLYLTLIDKKRSQWTDVKWFMAEELLSTCMNPLSFIFTSIWFLNHVTVVTVLHPINHDLSYSIHWWLFVKNSFCVNRSKPWFIKFHFMSPHSLHCQLKQSLKSTSSILFIILKTSIRSLRSRLVSSVVKFNFSNFSRYSKFLHELTVPVAHLCTFSIVSVSFLQWDLPPCTQYSRWGYYLY